MGKTRYFLPQGKKFSRTKELKIAKIRGITFPKSFLGLFLRNFRESRLLDHLQISQTDNMSDL